MLLASAASAASFSELFGFQKAIGPLHEAAANGNVDFVKSWIATKRNLDATYDEPSRGIEGNYARTNGITALMVAAKSGQLEIAKLLVEGGANLYAEARLRDGSYPRTAFDFGVEAKQLAVAEYLWRKSDGIHFATKLDKQIAVSCMESCDDKFGGDSRSNIALFLISITRDERMLGLGISEAASYSQQPLQLLAFLDKHAVRFPRNTLRYIVNSKRPLQERIAIASFFLDHGADPNDLPVAPLKLAAWNNDIEMMKFLLSRGADPNLQDADGVTAIGAAANRCLLGGKEAEFDPRLKAQTASIEYLAQAGSDSKIFASERARSRLTILADCCRRSIQAPSQRRICEIFGL